MKDKYYGTGETGLSQLAHKSTVFEKDPSGIGQHEIGAKLDFGKPLAAQILGQFSNALTEVARVGTFGAKKYTIGGWKHVEDGVIRYDNANMRHFLKRHGGEAIDEDSGLLHLSHEAWNALARLELFLESEKKVHRGESKGVQNCNCHVREKSSQ